MIWVLAALAILFGVGIFTSYIREDYDAERWETDPDYCRYGASLKGGFQMVVASAMTDIQLAMTFAGAIFSILGIGLLVIVWGST
jgi:hypothetical protein